MDRFSHHIGLWVEQTVSSTIGVLSYIPGSQFVGRYIQASHQNDPARTIFEILLFLFALRYFFAAKQPYNKSNIKLSKEEINALVEEWVPDPLTAPMTAENVEMVAEIPVLSTRNGPIVEIQGHDRPLLNFSSTDIYHWGHDDSVQQQAIDAVRYYGVGSCGPAGFYGNEDAHVDAEQAIAEFLGTPRSILYAQGLATATSVIPCFAKRGDILIVDSLVNMSIQRGLQLSRARVFWYKHNDMEDLEAQLKRANASYRKGPVPRRFVITEGLFEYTGQSPDLKKIIELKKKYKYRLILDESWSLGTMGPTGRGLVEASGVSRDQVEITIGSLATAVGTSGGFCAGETYMVEHQRIVSLAYTFSATCPPYLAKITKRVLGLIADPGFVKQRYNPLIQKATALYDEIAKSSNIEIISNRGVPVIIFQLSGQYSPEESEQILGRIVRDAREKDLLISRLRRVADFEVYPYVHAIRLYVPEGLTLAKIKDAGNTLVSVINRSTVS